MTIRPPNPQMITLARESRSLKQTALAQAIGLTQGALSKLENGQLTASDELVARLSRTLDYPKSLFSKEIALRQLPVSFFRKRASVSATAVRIITARLNLARFQLQQLLRSVEIPELLLPVGIDLRERRQSPERVAAEIRARWHLPAGPIPNLTAVLESAGVPVMRCNFDTRLVDAVSLYDERDALPPIIFVSDAIPGDRLRFSVAHEVGHIVLHHHLVLPPASAEEEANRFASELLMPAAEIRSYLTRLTLPKLANLKPYWKVAMQALLKRAEQLGCVTERQRRYLWVQMSRLGYRLNEPFPIEVEEPTLIKEIVDYHINQLGYSEEDVSEVTSLSPHEFQERYGRRPTLRIVKPLVATKQREQA